MKILIYILLLLLIAGCNSSPLESAGEDMNEHALTLNIHNPATRSMNGITAETWESKINTATIYVFNSKGNNIYTYTLKPAEITSISNNISTSIALSLSGTISSCDIYFVANTTPSSPVSTKASLLASIENDIASYNGTFDNVTTKALRTNGFVITGFVNGVNTQSSNTTLTLQRIVAKVGINIVFTAVINLGGISVNNIVITGSAPVSNLFSLASPNTTGKALSLSQAPKLISSSGGVYTYQAFFYLYEINPVAPIVNIYFNGSGTVAVLPIPFSYNFKITGDNSNGKISRNKGYYISITINKLTNIGILSDNRTILIKEL